MSRACSRHRCPRNPQLLRALLAAGFCLVAMAVFGAAGFERALASPPPVISLREVPPLVAFLAGRVEQSNNGGVTWVALPVGARVLGESLVKTGTDGMCVLVSSDNSLVAMKPGSTIQVLPQAREFRLAVLAGKVWVRFDYAVENDRNGIELAQAAFMALSAGSFSFETTASSSVVKVLEGAVGVAPRDGGRGVSVEDGQTLTADDGGLRPTIAFDIGLERTEWQALLGQAGLSVTTTTLGETTTSQYPPCAGPVPAWPAIVLLTFLGWAALAILGILGTFIYLGVNRHNRHQRADR